MKKIFGLILAIALTLAFTAGCGSADVSSFKTLGDLADIQEEGFVYGNGLYIAHYKIKGDYYRVEAALTGEVAAELDTLNWSDENFDADRKIIIEPLEITKITNLNDQLLSQDDLKQWIGKNGSDLVNAGWVPNGPYDDAKSMAMIYGPFEYKVTFDNKIPESSDQAAAIRPLTVKSMELIGLSQGIPLIPSE